MTEQILLYGTLIGIILTWGLNSISSYLTSKAADKRNLKRVLFILLEINYIISRSNPHVFKQVTNRIFFELHLNIPNEDKPIVDVFFRHLFESMLKDRFNNKFIDLKNSYVEAINKISEVDPIIAYLLSENTGVVEIMDNIEDRIKIIGLNNNIEIPNDNILTVMNSLKPSLYDDAVKQLESDILLVSKKINYLTFIRTKKTLKNNRFNSEENFKDFIEKIKGFKEFNELLNSVNQ